MRRLIFLLRLAAIPVALALALTGASVVAAAEPATGAGDVTVAGTGTLAAKGSGYVKLAGSFVLVGSMDGGWLSVTGIDPDTIVRVTGWTSKTRFADGSLLYRGVQGSFHVAGRTIRVGLGSADVRFVVTGHGHAYLKGRGTYRVNGGPLHDWPPLGDGVAY